MLLIIGKCPGAKISLFLTVFFKKSVKIFGHFGIYNLLFAAAHARRGLFFQKNVTFGEKVTYNSSKNSKNVTFLQKNHHIFQFPRFTNEKPGIAAVQT